MRLPKICLKYFFKLPPAVFVTNLDPGDSQVRRLQERPWERGWFDTYPTTLQPLIVLQKKSVAPHDFLKIRWALKSCIQKN